jgi:site-specific DNA recombinase
MSSSDRKRAALYLRVSSAGQVNTDYDPEGLSIPAQRQAGERKAANLDADIVREYVEPGVSGGSLTKRKAFRKMIDEIRELRDIDYVIVWSVSRWARNQEDHWTARGLVNRAGAKLISVKEPIGEDTSHGVMLEGVMAAVAAARRIEISEEVTRGIRRKIEVGGKPGLAPLGYLNVREALPHGGEVRTIVIDSERGPTIVWAFEAYATGMYSLIDMVTLLAAKGLRTRGNRRYSPRTLSLSAVHHMLSNPFYAGKIRYDGKIYPGRHEPLIDEELFEKVQTVLKAHNKSGERDRKHLHYLKGTIRCGNCNHRLTYSRHSGGRGGTYEYFVCSPSQRHECPHGFRPTHAIEALIERAYETVTLTTTQGERITSIIEKRLAKVATTSKQELRRCETVLAGLKEQEKKLLEKHYQDEVSKELYTEEIARIKRERTSARAVTNRMNVRHDELSDFMKVALRVATANLHDLYLRAKPHVRRLMNQALFEVIWIEDADTEVHFKLASPFDGIITLEDQVANVLKHRERHQTEPKGILIAAAHKNDEAPDPGEESEDFDAVSISNVLVETVGIEPTSAVA